MGFIYDFNNVKIYQSDSVIFTSKPYYYKKIYFPKYPNIDKEHTENYVILKGRYEIDIPLKDKFLQIYKEDYEQLFSLWKHHIKDGYINVKIFTSLNSYNYVVSKYNILQYTFDKYPDKVVDDLFPEDIIKIINEYKEYVLQGNLYMYIPEYIDSLRKSIIVKLIKNNQEAL